MSVVVAVRNGERFLGEALGSILRQTWQSLEIIVIDGHSTDQTPAIVRSFPDARHLVQRGHGIGDAYNTGIAEAHGDFIAFLSHDDLWTPHKIAAQMRVMQDSPDIGFAVGHVRFFLEPGSRLPPGFRPALLEGTHPACIMEVLLARRTVFDSVGPFDGALSSGEDVDWFSRARDLGVRHAVVPDVVLHKRVHDTNLSLNDPATNTILLDVVRRSIARKRQAPPSTSR